MFVKGHFISHQVRLLFFQQGKKGLGQLPVLPNTIMNLGGDNKGLKEEINF